MKKGLLVLFGVLFLSIPSFSQKSDTSFKPSIKFGGRIMFDFGFNTQNSDHTSGSEFRRARTFISGKVAANVAYKFQVDFSKRTTVFKDVYIKLLNVPKIGGTFTVGNFKEPSSLNILTSSKYITFIERSFTTNYHQARSTGFMYDKVLLNKRMGFQIAYNTNSDINGLDKQLNEGQNITFRVSGLVLKNKDKKQILHLGTSFSNRVPSKNDAGIRTYNLGIRPDSHLASKIISHTFTDVNHINISGLEMAYTYGAFSIQSEYVSAKVDTKLESITVPSYYAYISYFLTKEHRPFKSSYGGFSRVKPHHNFDNKKGWGALQVALRVSSFDLTDANQGKLNDITLGLNWHLNANTRIMYNYVNGDSSLSDTNFNAHLLRFQVDF